METTKVELPPPPGIIASLKAGFDAIASHITAILLPLLLDLFLWLGPRLHIETLFNSVKGDMITIWKSAGLSAADIQKMLADYEKIIPSINLFWLLRTLPIGISSMVFSDPSPKTPLGAPIILQADALSLFGWIFMLTFIGWIGGGLYFRSVAWVSTGNQEEDRLGILRAVIQTVLLSILWTILSFVIGIPVFLVLSLVLQINEFVANIAVLVLSLASMWVVVPIFFWPHGIFIRKQNFLASGLSSLQMTRFTLPTSSLFILTIFLLTVGLNFLWSIPPENSWMTLLGIFGHAFVTTGLLAASFIYYRDMNLWLQKVIERLRPNALKKA
ncbi:MAG: hypothetical protein U0Z26_07320 [Anaerolineales bacterium]